MYMPPTFLTPEVLARILEEYQWPAPYTLEDELPDGIAMVLPKCTLFFSEGFESEMNLSFPTVTEFEDSIDLTEVIIALRSEDASDDKLAPAPVGRHIPGASLEKVENGIRNRCNWVRTYLGPTLEGDFGWVETLKRYRARRGRTT
jgi:hypothetical protein